MDKTDNGIREQRAGKEGQSHNYIRTFMSLTYINNFQINFIV